MRIFSLQACFGDSFKNLKALLGIEISKKLENIKTIDLGYSTKIAESLEMDSFVDWFLFCLKNKDFTPKELDQIDFSNKLLKKYIFTDKKNYLLETFGDVFNNEKVKNK